MMLSNYLVVLSFVVWLVSFWNRNNIPEELFALEQLKQAPRQVETSESTFSVDIQNMRYTIEPLYDYELYGLVVSYRHHSGKFGLHKLWQDHLNVADLCVVWSHNAFDAQLHKLDFWNGQFTCNVKTKDMNAWQSFDMFSLSNNHLLTTNDYIRGKLEDIRIGDQIRIKGWLSNYRNSEGGFRGTSTTRKDTGNGACETIFVTELDILSHFSNGWRKLMYFSALVLLVSLVWYFLSPRRVR